ncbi:MAG TPA: AI-2E family transporter, partial [Longimicrobiaceae bacterium]
MRLRTVESRVFLTVVIATTIFFLWMVRGFLLPVFWAAVFALLFRPLYLRLLRAVRGRRGLAALLSTLIIVVVVLVPVGLLLAAVAQQGLWLYQGLSSGEIDIQSAVEYVERSVPPLTALLARYGVGVEQIRTAIESGAIAVTQYLGSQALALGQNALLVAVLFGLMLYLLFFFFRDGERIVKGVIRALPMGDVREQRLFTKFADVSRATVKGTLLVAAVQGALGGVLFALVGIPAALFWGVVMGVLSLLPAVGAALVWVPAAIILFVTGGIWQGIVVVLGGTFAIGLTDNLLRPILIGRETRIPDYLVLVATLGGLSVFGLAGFVAGPVVAALFLVMWEMFADEYAPLDTAEPAGVA